MAVTSGVKNRTRQAIIDAAIDLLAANPACSLGDIAAAAQVGRTTLHRYFAERADLLAAVGAEGGERLERAVAAELAPLKLDKASFRVRLDALPEDDGGQRQPGGGQVRDVAADAEPDHAGDPPAASPQCVPPPAQREEHERQQQQPGHDRAGGDGGGR